jgi:1,4-dihydroxy-6-naphthoate synthase
MKPARPFSLGFSPCPNDTFIFCDLVACSETDSEPFFAPPHLEDVETLNQWARSHRLDVTKLSFHAIAHVLDEYCILSAGAALGRGCGPLLVTSGNRPAASLEGARVAIPGRFTTAALLFQMFCPQAVDLVEMRFERIIEAVAAGAVDAGVIIHESRFTYQQSGLVCMQDLGQWWEQVSGLPIPLGCIGVRRSIGLELIGEIEDRIRASLQWARAHPDQCRDYIKRYAQEIDDQVVAQHIALYVNDFSLDLGEVGRQAVVAFFQRGRHCGALPSAEHELFCCRTGT